MPEIRAGRILRSMIIDSVENTAAYTRLLETLRSRRSLGFVGAGATNSLGYPTWPVLIQRLATEARHFRGEQLLSNGLPITVKQVLEDCSDLSVQAQVLKENLGRRYFAVIRRLFSPRDTFTKPVANLVKLPFRHFLTSNYDMGLELHHALGSRPPSICLYDNTVPEFLGNFMDDNYPRRVVHVHGRYDEPERLILTHHDYDAYKVNPIFERFWEVMTTAATLVFFGFSFTDLDLLYGFGVATRILRTNNENLEARHFAVVGLGAKSLEAPHRITFRMKYGIDPVYFLQEKGDFSGYEDLLENLISETIVPPAEPVEVLAYAPTGELLPSTAAAGFSEYPQESEVDHIREGVEHLRQMTRGNLRRRQTGDLE